MRLQNKICFKATQRTARLAYQRLNKSLHASLCGHMATQVKSGLATELHERTKNRLIESSRQGGLCNPWREVGKSKNLL